MANRFLFLILFFSILFRTIDSRNVQISNNYESEEGGNEISNENQQNSDNHVDECTDGSEEYFQKQMKTENPSESIGTKDKSGVGESSENRSKFSESGPVPTENNAGSGSDVDRRPSEMETENSVDENGSSSTTEIATTDNTENQIAELKKQLVEWDNSVHNYFKSLAANRDRVRQRRQSQWSQLFPAQSQSTSGVSGSTNSKNQGGVASFASNALDEALQPAVSLMNQGVSILSNLYSSQIKQRSATTGNGENETIANDQFASQLKELQGKLTDVKHQLQRVVGSFQNLQLPFLDNFMGGNNAAAAFGFPAGSEKENKLFYKKKK